MINISLQKIYSSIEEANSDIENITEGNSVIAGGTMYLKKDGKLVEAVDSKER